MEAHQHGHGQRSSAAVDEAPPSHPGDEEGAGEEAQLGRRETQGERLLHITRTALNKFQRKEQSTLLSLQEAVITDRRPTLFDSMPWEALWDTKLIEI